jgi:hypothetical protein
MESDPGMLTWLQKWKQHVIDKEDGTTFALWEESNFQEESGEAHVASTMLQLTNESCNLEYFSPIEASQGDSEPTVAHGIDNSANEIIIVPNTL